MLSVADFAFAAVLGNGLALTASAPRRIQQATAGAFTFEIDHEDASGGVHLRSKIRLRAYPGQRFLRLHHRLEVISPALAPAAAGGPQPSDCPEFLRGAIAGIEGERSALLKLRCFSIGIPIAAPRRVQQAGESWPLNGSRWQLRQDHDLAYAVGLEQRPGAGPGPSPRRGRDRRAWHRPAPLLAKIPQSPFRHGRCCLARAFPRAGWARAARRCRCCPSALFLAGRGWLSLEGGLGSEQ